MLKAVLKYLGKIYENTARFMWLLQSAKAKATILIELRKIERMDLFILDDFGMQPSNAVVFSQQ